MTVFLLACVGSFVAALGGGGQVLVARLTDRLGRSVALLAVALIVAVLTATLAAAVGGWLAPRLMPILVTQFLALALTLAAIGLLLPVRQERLAEPTRSLGAIGFVLFARQILDGPRLIVCAVATFAAPELAGLGGALGAAGAAILGWALAARLEGGLPLILLRRIAAGALLAAAIATLTLE